MGRIEPKDQTVRDDFSVKEAFWIIDQLIRQGVVCFCIAPGSRNTPLVVAAAEHPQAKTIVHFDERGLGFYALGYAKGSKRPAAVLTTSGTAVGNLFPSVMEAFHSYVPMILLTADRPPELRDCGANQTCDQIKLFSTFVRWQTDLPPHLNESFFRSIVDQGFFHATQNPPGPIQINCQFRDPLYIPASPKEPQNISIARKTSIFPSEIVPKPIEIKTARGLIAIGPIPCDPTPILALAKRLQWPVFSDILSNARCHVSLEQIRHFDWIVKTTPDLKPDFILHFGERLVSKTVLDWAPTLHVSPYPFLRDPSRLLTSRLQSDIEPFCQKFTAKTDPSWLCAWKKRDAEIDAISKTMFEKKSSFTEAHAMQRLSKMLPENGAVFLANGMPIRDGDLFLFPKTSRGFFGNRGLSGIDGNIATAAGLSEGLNTPVVAFVGDQACLHDLNSLPLLTKTKKPVILIASNNFGGGIFSHLPISQWPHFETFMAATHCWRFEDAAKMFNLPYFSFEQMSFETSALVELITSREENHRFHQEFLKNCRTLRLQENSLNPII